MFRFLAAAALTALIATQATAQAPSKYERLTQALWSAVNENYYDPYFRGADWAAAKTRYETRAHAVHTDAEFRALANAMLAEIPSSHLYIVPPIQVGPAGIGAHFATLDGNLVIHDVAPLSDAWTQGVRPGDRLLSDRASLSGALGSAASLRVQHCDGRTQNLSVRRERAFWPPEHPGFRWSRIASSATHALGYIRIDRFDDGAAELANRAMTELGDTQGLIIDIRENSGGNVSAQRLGSYFGPGAEPGVILFSRPYLEALGHPVTPADIRAAPRVDHAYTDAAVFDAISSHHGGAAFWTDDIAHKYASPVIVLIGEDTGSAAEGFAWYMRERTHARLIGRTTAGELLSATEIEIGDGWKVTVPVHGLWGADGQDYGDRAVPPHQIVTWTRADLCAGRDPDLQAAFKALGG